jgi:hypothetical protein
MHDVTKDETRWAMRTKDLRLVLESFKTQDKKLRRDVP